MSGKLSPKRIGQLRPKILLKEKLIEQFAERNRRRRVAQGLPADAEEDQTRAERKAKRIIRSPIRLFLYKSRQSFGRSFGDWDRDDWFQVSEVVGVILVPVLILVLQVRYQNQLEAQNLERARQDSVRNYYNQLSDIYLNLDGESLADEKNKQLLNLTIASTHAILYDPNLDGVRKGEVLSWLSTMGLVQAHGEKEPSIPLRGGIDLSGTNLTNADLSGANLILANLSSANLILANLSSANFFSANLSEANLTNANLSKAHLTNANLRNTDLRGADLKRADLRGADLKRADLRNTDFSNANLSAADLSSAIVIDRQLEEAEILCETKLPANSKLDGDRDCPK
jgi:uncharacterized protein YjbI with pentapeptide repeats